MTHNPDEIDKEALAYETYKRVPYYRETVYEVVDAFLAVLHDMMLDKKPIRLYKIGTFLPRVRRMRRKLGWDESKVYDVDKLSYIFKASYAFKLELDVAHKKGRKHDDFRERGTAGEAQAMSSGSGERQ